MPTEQKQEIRVQIRWMIRRDMPEVLQIDAKASSSLGLTTTSFAACGNATASAWSRSMRAASSVS